MTSTSVSSEAQQIGELTGTTQRQLDYWARCGVFGDDFIGKGSGTQRPWWTPHLAEIVYACARLADLRAPVAILQLAAPVVRARPVGDSEWLIVTDDGAVRYDHFCLDDKAPRLFGYVVALRSFAAVRAPEQGDTNRGVGTAPTPPGAVPISSP